MNLKTIGLLGGMSWESSAVYYKLLNELVRDRLGGLHSAKIIMESYDFCDIVECQQSGDWDKATKILVKSAQNLEQSGADMILICTNTMHLLAERIQESIGIPVIHIVDVVAERAREKGIRKLGLLGTRYTMEHGFYKERLESHGIDVVVPDEKERQIVHQVIFDELCQGIIKNESRENYLEIIEGLVHRGAEGMILGCTEIPLLIEQNHVSIPLFDTTFLHAEKAVEFTFSDHEILV